MNDIDEALIAQLGEDLLSKIDEIAKEIADELSAEIQRRRGYEGGNPMNDICPYLCSFKSNSGYCNRTGGYDSCQYRKIVGYNSEEKRFYVEPVDSYEEAYGGNMMTTDERITELEKRVEKLEQEINSQREKELSQLKAELESVRLQAGYAQHDSWCRRP